MPQLAKGGKYVFGWSRIMDNGCIVIPTEAINEYKLNPGTNVILISASKTSGGFIIADKSLLEQSALGRVFVENPEQKNFQIEEGKIIESPKRKCCWVKIRKNNVMILGRQTLEAFGLKPGDNLLSVRGSYVGIAMIVKGPLIEHAKKHPEVKHLK